jgi:hypothetical protein
MNKFFKYLRLSVWTADLAWKVVTFVVVTAGGTTAGILAASSQLFHAWGALAWFAVGIIAAVAISLIVFLVRAAQRAAAEAALATAMATKPSSVNPLLTSFSDQVIPMAALHIPGRQVHQHKQFRRCKFVGPGALALLGGTFVNSSFKEAGHVLTIPENTVITGITVFENCTVEDCEFFQITLLIPRASAAQFAAGIPGASIAM